MIYRKNRDITMSIVKTFESWKEEYLEEVPHKDLYELCEEILNAWKAWKENEDEDKDEEELHDEFMSKMEGFIDKAKDLIS